MTPIDPVYFAQGDVPAPSELVQSDPRPVPEPFPPASADTHGRIIDPMRPDHYGSWECLEIMTKMAEGKPVAEGLCVAQAVKYLYRYDKKGGIADVEKARDYLNKLLKDLKYKQTGTGQAG